MRKPARLPGRILAITVVFAALCIALSLVSTAAAEGDANAPLSPDETSFDGAGAVFAPDDDLAYELVIQNFASSGLSVRWAANLMPVAFCTIQANRPAGVTAEQFRDSVRLAAEMWNDVDAAVGVRYTGDCLPSFQIDLDNDQNEIGWDDSRNLVSGSQAGITQGSWRTSFGRREFTETDIVLDSNLRVPDACLRTVMAHEIGHALGFGHSDDRGDLMFPSFTASNLATCRPTASAAEAAWLTNLYGSNLKPVVMPPGDRSVQPGAVVSLNVQATDPDGDTLTYEWKQTAGATTTLTTSGSTVTLTAPPSGSLTLEVAAIDRFLHRATTKATLSVVAVVSAQGAATTAPATPSLQSILSNSARSASSLKWSGVEGAQSHEFCVTTFGNTKCTAQALSSAETGWATSLASGGRMDEQTVLSLDMRATGMRACNALGCSNAGVGPLMGGLRWTNWGISYDVIAMAFDVPGTPVRFTIAGAVNLGVTSRRFVVYSGPEEDPARTLVKDCGVLEPGQSCIGLLGPSDAGHSSYAVVESKSLGTPGATHRVRLR